MDLDAITQRLEALFAKRQEPGALERMWAQRAEPTRIQADALTALFKQLRSGTSAQEAVTTLHFLAACRELAANVEVIEALADAQRHPPFAYVTWLWRVSESLRRVSTAANNAKLALELPEKREAQPKKFVPRLPPLAEPALPLPTGERLQGFAIEPLIDLANRETQVLERRRRLLEAARRALLETAAALPAPPEQLEPRLLAVTAAIQEITEWQQAGVDPTQDMTHQLRRAVHARDSATVSELLDIMSKLGSAAPLRRSLASRLNTARTKVAGRLQKAAPPSLEEVSERVFGAAASAAVLKASARAQQELDAAPATATELVQAANSVDASFELGRSVSPVRAIEEQRRMALVNFPTQTMVLKSARSVADLPNALIHDPRLVLYGLATRSLLARRFLAERKVKRSTTTRCAEARYYLLDGSASMGGRRGRMRDAILISELSMLIRHLETGTAAARPIVYYRYFSRTAEQAIKVSSIEEALAAIDATILRRSRGETDIQSALIDSFHQINKERQRDPNLQRAQIVLVTDGIAEINLWSVWRAREALGGMPVRVSVIALGSESPKLKELAATQRSRGEPVFYHYLSDQAMSDLLRRTRIARPPLSFPELPDSEVPPPPQALRAKPPVQPNAESSPSEPNTSSEPAHIPIVVELELWQELDQLVDELSVLHEPPDAEALENVGLMDEAYAELFMSLDEQGNEAERAQAEALRRDARAVGVRFERWFPDPDEPAEQLGAPPPAELLEIVEIVVCTVAELTDFLSGTPVSRRVDAIELLERLLLEAGVSPWAYTRALPHATDKCREALRALRQSALS
ncbi:MAG TPA: vWA domain-containing protein [Polyangiaceae bacterium]|nr:vWA domain-containing protein [Polyangiaceae bacterium]